MGEIIEANPAHADGHAVTAIKDITYGSFAGMVGKVIEYPFDTIKVRLQTQTQFKGPLDCFTQGLKSDGITGLYRGITPPMFGAAAENAGLFFSYTISQNLFRKFIYTADSGFSADEKLPLPALLTCGAISGAFCSLILTPIELIKCKMQVQAVSSSEGAAAKSASSAAALPSTGRSYTTAAAALPGSGGGIAATRPRYAGPISLISEVVRVYGIKGLWHGQMGTFLRETGGGAVWFGAYEYVGLAFRKIGGTVGTDGVTIVPKDKNSAGEMMIAGACAGVSYNGVLFPADTIKSRMQTSAVGAAGHKQMGFLATGTEIYRAGGVAALYRGCGITVLRAAPASAVIFLVYESLKANF